MLLKTQNYSIDCINICILWHEDVANEKKSSKLLQYTNSCLGNIHPKTTKILI